MEGPDSAQNHPVEDQAPFDEGSPHQSAGHASGEGAQPATNECYMEDNSPEKLDQEEEKEEDGGDKAAFAVDTQFLNDRSSGGDVGVEDIGESKNINIQVEEPRVVRSSRENSVNDRVDSVVSGGKISGSKIDPKPSGRSSKKQSVKPASQSRSRSSKSRAVVKKVDSKDIKKQLAKLPRKNISPSQRDELNATFRQLEADFQLNLARIYNKGAHKSGVQKCHELIEKNAGSPEVVTIFLKALSNKNLLQVAKDASANSFQFLQFHASLFGLMGAKFKQSLKDPAKDPVPSVVKTVRRMLTTMKELFFAESHDNVRNACALSFREILDNCFTNKMYSKGQKPAKDILFDCLFEELQGGKNRIAKQTACYIIRKLNEWYMGDSQVIDTHHCQMICAMGIQFRVYDCDFLMAIVDLINNHGPTVTIGKNIAKAVEYFIASLKFNVTGKNAIGRVQRDQNICASLTILTVFATSLIGLEYAAYVNENYGQLAQAALDGLKGENLQIQRLKAQCLNAWKRLADHCLDQGANAGAGSQKPATSKVAAQRPKTAAVSKFAALNLGEKFARRRNSFKKLRAKMRQQSTDKQTSIGYDQQMKEINQLEEENERSRARSRNGKLGGPMTKTSLGPPSPISVPIQNKSIKASKHSSGGYAAKAKQPKRPASSKPRWQQKKPSFETEGVLTANPNSNRRVFSNQGRFRSHDKRKGSSQEGRTPIVRVPQTQAKFIDAISKSASASPPPREAKQFDRMVNKVLNTNKINKDLDCVSEAKPQAHLLKHQADQDRRVFNEQLTAKDQQLNSFKQKLAAQDQLKRKLRDQEEQNKRVASHQIKISSDIEQLNYNLNSELLKMQNALQSVHKEIAAKAASQTTTEAGSLAIFEGLQNHLAQLASKVDTYSEVIDRLQAHKSPEREEDPEDFVAELADALYKHQKHEGAQFSDGSLQSTMKHTNGASGFSPARSNSGGRRPLSSELIKIQADDSDASRLVEQFQNSGAIPSYKPMVGSAEIEDDHSEEQITSPKSNATPTQVLPPLTSPSFQPQSVQKEQLPPSLPQVPMGPPPSVFEMDMAKLEKMKQSLMPSTEKPLSFIDQRFMKMQEMENRWLKVSELAFRCEFETALQLALTQLDDIYFMRLLVQLHNSNGDASRLASQNLLSVETLKKCLERVNRINRHGKVPQTLVDWIEDARRQKSAIQSMSRGEQNEYLDTMVQMKRSALWKKNICGGIL